MPYSSAAQRLAALWTLLLSASPIAAVHWYLDHGRYSSTAIQTCPAVTDIAKVN